MGAKTNIVACVEGDAVEILRSNPQLDREASAALAGRLFSGEILEPAGEGTLLNTCPDEDEVYVGCFPGLTIISASELTKTVFPSQLDAKFVDAATAGTVYLHLMESVSGSFAYAVWHNGKLERALGVTPEGPEVFEDIGMRLAFEAFYWEKSAHPAFEPGEGGDFPLQFQPLDLGEAALKALFGYQLEGEADETLLDPETIPLLHFKRRRPPRKPWWQFWWLRLKQACRA